MVRQETAIFWADNIDWRSRRHKRFVVLGERRKRHMMPRGTYLSEAHEKLEPLLSCRFLPTAARD